MCDAQIGDFGRRGAYNQTAVARLLAAKAADLRPDFVISVGDNMYPSGLSSPEDAAFDASFVQPYSAKSLQVPWQVASPRIWPTHVISFP